MGRRSERWIDREPNKLLRFSETCELCSSQRASTKYVIAAVNHNYGDSKQSLKNRHH